MATVHVRYLRDAATLYGDGLSYATSGSAGMDLRACWVEPQVPGVAGFIYSRSGLGAVKGLAVAQGVGVVDADYRGEVVVWLLNTSGEAVSVRRGERVAQLVFQPVCRLEPLAVETLSETGRGAGGFGHTGRV